MNAFAPLLAALAIVQATPPEPHPAAEPAERLPAAKEPAAAPAKEPAAAAVKDPAAAPAERSAAPKEAVAPRAEAPAPSPSAATTTARPARPPRPTARPEPSPSPALVSTTARTRPPVAPTPSPQPSPPARAGGEGGKTVPLPERDDAERAARAFLDALVARDAGALAAASAERFSFDGDAQAGRDAIRRTWRAILAGREGAPPRLGSVEILPAADAVARFGKPPARIATLARPGVLVAVADVGGRTVVLFLAKEAGRMAVLGMHD